MGLLDGRRAVVTGGASGIGRATARRMAEEGAVVAILDLDGDGADAVAKEVGGPAHQVDVTDPEALTGAIDASAAAMGGLHLLFNNAGTSNLMGVADYGPDEWDRVVRVNLHGVHNGFRAGVPHLRRSGGGAIVSTASISGTRPSAGEAPYSAAKAGVAALTASAALELAPDIRVNAVSPGMIATGLTAPLLTFDEQVDRFVRTTPMARIGEPEDIADVVVFLCSDLARFITGQNLVVDGGMTLHGAGVDGLLTYFSSLVGNHRAGNP